MLEGDAIASAPTDATIARIEGWILGAGSVLPGLLLLRVTDSSGRSGVGETFYLPDACWAVTEHLMAPRLLGRPLTELGGFFGEIQAALHRMVGIGAEFRTLSALDVAIWDLAAKSYEQPLRRVLSQASKDSVEVYNSCVGPSYTTTATVPGDGNVDQSDPNDDYGAWMTDAGALARDLVGKGFSGMKLWPFDRLAKACGGKRPSAADLAEAARPLLQIREAVGDQIDIMIDGHGLWSPEAAVEVAATCGEYDVRWVEDLVLAHPLDGLRHLKANTDVPILASEYLATRAEYEALLAAEVVDIVMVDPTWAGGVTQGMALAELCARNARNVSYHDCTGPATLLAGATMAAAVPNHEIQEFARGLFDHAYGDIAEMDCQVQDGRLVFGSEPGLGLTVRPDLDGAPGVTYRRLDAP